jgi:predicted  nucleic acid-binding Zn-ribbon protein
MSKVRKLQHDIARTLYLLLPVEGVPKTLQEIRDQIRLLNEIRDPSDERLSRVIVGYFRDPRYSRDARFLKIDKLLSDEDLSARWTRVRIGPTVSKPATGAGGGLPNQEFIEEKLPAISASCAHSPRTSFYLWDLLKEHFGVTRDNNRYYRQWLEALSDALKTDPRFVILAVDVETNIPVEWMLAVDRELQVNDAVRSKLQELIAFMQRGEHFIHLTRGLVHRFFAPDVVDETYDMHTYYKAVSKMLADTPSAIRISVQDGARWAEAWCLRERIRKVIHSRVDSILSWLRAVGTPQPVDVMLRQCFKSLPELTSTDALADEVSQALAEDLRFLFDGPAGGWRAIPPGPPENLPAYHVLWEHRRPLSDDALIEKVRDDFPTLRPDFNLVDDNRFRIWRGEKWGLSQWIDINDWAYEYLREKKMVLLPTTIVTKVCEQHGIAAGLAVFTPEDDPRFVPRLHGRWYYRHRVTDAELDQMLALLCSLDDGGLILDELVVQAIGLEASDTDASERLAQDEHFVLVAGRWFAREKAFYSLTDEDVEQLLTALLRERTGLRLTTLVRQVLDREDHLTDAEARLRTDSRFQEILPGVWMVKDLQPPSEGRIPIFNRPICSERVSVVPEDEYTVTEDLTERESRPSGETVSISQRQITHTLSLLDVRHGNLVIDRAVVSLMPPDDKPAIHFTDELGDEFTSWVDKENNLLQGLGSWFEARRLTFGDKITIKATAQVGFLEIQPKGQRDERVYQEALQRQDIEKLIESARQTRKSYHDLMMEVMNYFNQASGEPVPLHREDIYNLVNYNRTASRSYIFSLLSLTACPYEELRYFVSHGRGYWSFDRGRRKAFEMKMKELVERVEQLEAENERLQQNVASAQTDEGERGAEIARLTEQAREQEARIAELSTQNARLSETNQRLRANNEDQLRRIKELDTQILALKAQATKQATELEALRSSQESLQKELADTQGERAELQDSQKRQTRRVEELMQDKTTLEREFAALQAKVEQLPSQNTTLQENIDRLQGQVDTLTNEKTTLRQQHEQAIATLEGLAEDSKTRQKELQSELELERNRGQQLQKRLEALERWSGIKAEEAAQLSAKIYQARVALRTPLGKGFVVLLRLLGGSDLSDL